MGKFPRTVIWLLVAAALWEMVVGALKALSWVFGMTQMPSELVDTIKLLGPTLARIASVPDWLFWVLLGAPLLLVVAAVFLLVRHQHDDLARRVQTAPINDPRAEWLTISSAPFILPKLAQFDQPRAFWREDDLNKMLSAEHSDKQDFTNGQKIVRGEVDWRMRCFMWYSETGRGLGYSPWELANTTEPAFGIVTPQTWKSLQARGGAVWEYMNESVRDLLDQGRLQVWARVGFATADFAKVTADSWRHFHVIDWETGEARTDAGDRLYSVHIEIVSPAEAPARRWRLGIGRKRKP